MKELTQERLKELVSYDQETGVFYRIGPHTFLPKWRVAGWQNASGYIVIDIDGRHYRAHRLAWLYVYGEMPQFVDHKNCIRTDNRIANLRCCNKSQNNANSRVRKDSASGVKGAYFHKLTNRWHAYITVNKKRIHLGCFATVEEANDAYLAAAKHHFGEFARAA